MAEPPENPQNDPSVNNILRSASVIACSATGYACLLEDLMLTSNTMESSTNINAPATGPTPGAANEIMQSAGVIACLATGYSTPAESVERSLRVIETAAVTGQLNRADSLPPSVSLHSGSSSLHAIGIIDDTTTRLIVRGRISFPDEARPSNRELATASLASTSTSSTLERSDAEAAGSSTRRSTRSSNATGRSDNAVSNMAKDDGSSSRHSSQSDVKYFSRLQRITRSSLRSGLHNIADGNISSIICTTRSARSNSFRARRDALKARGDASRARTNATRAASAINGIPSTSGSSARGSSGRSARSIGGTSNSITRSSNGTSGSMRSSATDISSIAARYDETTNITVNTSVDTPLPISAGPSRNNGESSGTSNAIALLASGSCRVTCSARRSSSAIPLPAGDMYATVTQSVNSTSSGIPLQAAGETRVTTRSTTVSSIAITIPSNGISGHGQINTTTTSTRRTATITSHTITLPISGRSAISQSDSDAISIPMIDGPEVSALSDNNKTDAIMLPVNDTSIDSTHDATYLSDDIADSPATPSMMLEDVIPQRNISYMPNVEAMTETGEPRPRNIIVHLSNITVRPLSTSTSLPSVIAASPSTVDSVSTVGAPANNDERAPNASSDADGSFII